MKLLGWAIKDLLLLPSVIRDLCSAIRNYRSLKIGLPIVAIFLAYGGYLVGNIKNLSFLTVNNFPTAETAYPAVAPTAQNGGQVMGSSLNCVEYKFDDGEWDLGSYKKPNDEGYYCSRRGSGFPFPHMWNDKMVRGDFKTINVSAQVLNESKNQSRVGPLIISLGNVPPIWRLYAFEQDPRLVGFEQGIYDDKKKETVLSRVEPKALSAPIRYGSQVDISIRPVVSQQNEVAFAFDFSYINADSGDTKNKTLIYDNLKLSTPTLVNTDAQLGIGTSKGTCIKPIRVEVCY